MEFLEKNKVVLNSKKNQEKIDEIVAKLGDRKKLEKYFLYLINTVNSKIPEIKENNNGKKNISGFFIGILHSDNYLMSFLIELEKNKYQLAEYQNKFNLELDSRIKSLYQKDINNSFISFLENNVEKYKSEIESIVEKFADTNNFFRKEILSKYVGDDKVLKVLKDPMLISKLLNSIDLFEYKAPYSFEEWSESILKDKKEIIENFKVEIVRNLRMQGITKPDL